MKKIFFITILIGISFFAMAGKASAADRYWVRAGGDGGGVFSYSDNTHWSIESGGAGGASVPAIGDTAIFDENSFTPDYPPDITIGAEVLCAITMKSGVNRAYWHLAGILSLQAPISFYYLNITGTFITNNYPVSLKYVFQVEVGGNAYLGSSVITVGDPENAGTVSINSSAGVIDGDEASFVVICTDTNQSGFNGGGHTYGSLEVSGAAGAIDFQDDDTFGSLSIIGDIEVVFLKKTQTIINSSGLTLRGITPGGLILHEFIEPPWTINKTSGTVNAVNCTIANGIATGGATFNAFTTDGNVDGGGNTGWNFEEPVSANRYWVGGTGGEWNDRNHWSFESGGVNGAPVPDANSDVIFDANSITTTGQKVLFPPAEANTLLLNFDGIDGATTWVEEAQGLEPIIWPVCELDTTQAYSGTSSLRLVANEFDSVGVDYIVPNIPADFTYTSYFQFHEIDNYVDPIYMWDDGGIAYIEVELYYNSYGDTFLDIWGQDSDGNGFENYVEITTLTPDEWHKLQLTVSGRDITVSIDDAEVNTWTAEIDDPLLGLDYLEFWNGNQVPGNDLWIDQVSLTSDGTNYLSSLDMENLDYPITMNSIGETDPWYISVLSGIVEAFNTTLINSQAIGGATFNAFLSNGNVDGGNNTGWNFGESPEPEPSGVIIELTSISDITQDSVKLKVAVPDYPNQELDFTVKIHNKDKDTTDHKSFTETTDSEGKVTRSIDNLDSGTDYEFSVKFSLPNKDDFSDYSNSKDATTLDDIQGAECIPTKLTATTISTTQINLTWKDNCQGEDGFNIERKTAGGSFTKIDQIAKNQENYSNTGLISNTTYTYRVRAYNGSRFSDYSNEATATTFKRTTATTTVTTAATATTATTAATEEPPIIPPGPTAEDASTPTPQEDPIIKIPQTKPETNFLETLFAQKTSIALFLIIIGLLIGLAITLFYVLNPRERSD